MKILMISALDFKEKSIQVIKKTPLAYAERGHEVYYLTYQRERGERDYFYERELQYVHDNVEIIRFKLPARSLERRSRGPLRTGMRKLRLSVGFPLVARRLGARLLRDKEIDLLYGYEIFGVLAVAGLRRRYGLPQVSRYQGTLMAPLLDSKLELLKKFEHVLALRRPGDLTIMTDDGTLGDEVLRRLNSPVKQLLFLRNGVDKQLYLPNFDKAAFKAELGLPATHQLILSVSRLAGWKRVDRIIDAVPAILASCPETTLLIVGDGAQRQVLETQAERLSVGSHVRFVGAIPHHQVSRYYAAADVFISTYDLSNLGNPLLEALSAGKAIVTLNNGGTDRVIQHDYNGVLLEPDDIDSLSAAVINLLTDKVRRTQMEQNALAYAKTHLWDWDERMAVEVEAVERLAASRLIGRDEVEA
jgi:glycosyltransferase involved in cell wall biosynthesis